MTICIAGICDSGEHVVVAVDRMFTLGPPLNIEFEPPLSKIEQISPTCVALAAGNSAFAQEIITRARAKLEKSRAIQIMEISTSVKDEYAHFRDEKVEEHVIRMNLGQDFLTFREKGGFLPGYLQQQPMIYQQILIQANQFNLTVELIIAGCDTAGSHIFYVGHPGTLFNLDKLGYNAVGTGAVHAVTSLSLGGHTPKSSLVNTLASVYTAKRAAEVAPGVGKETEVAVISKADVWVCTSPVVKELEKAFEERVQRAAPNLDELGRVYGEQRNAAAVH
jgi:20S proteasome alpha/beta subunit